MIWLIVSAIAYLLSAVASLGDKYILAGPPKPKTYSFYVGTLGILVLFLIPITGFSVPGMEIIAISLIAGALFIFGLFAFYNGLEEFEASRIVPAIGGLVPIFTFGLVYLFFDSNSVLSYRYFLSLALLLSGSVFITLKTRQAFFSRSLKISLVAAFLLALSFVLTKKVYLAQPFWHGFIWIRMGAFLAGLSFLFSKEVRREIFMGHSTFKKKTSAIFLANQVVGASAGILQNWAISLANFAYLAVINALQGVQYVFLFIFTALLAPKFPKVFQEELSRRVIVRKIVAILFIGAGLAVLAIQ